MVGPWRCRGTQWDAGDVMALWGHGGPWGGQDTLPPVSAACECEPLGAESLQCEQSSGQCRCRPGFGGLRCNHCQRGYQEAFPRCSPCHPCFGRWDPALGSLREGLRRLGAQARALQEGGSMPPLSPRRLRVLEEALGRVERLLGEGVNPGGPLLDGLPGWLDGTRQVWAVGWAGGHPPFVTQKGLRPFYPPIKEWSWMTSGSSSKSWSNIWIRWRKQMCSTVTG